MKLAVSDLVVVPGCGVGEVEAIETLELGGEQVRTYRIAIRGSDVRTWIPIHRLYAEGIRKPLDTDAVDATWQLIRDKDAPKKRGHWKRRQQRYHEAIQSGELDRMAEVVGELASVAAQKRENKQTLTFGERRILEKAKDLIVAEISAITGKKLERVEARMDQVIAEAG